MNCQRKSSSDCEGLAKSCKSCDKTSCENGAFVNNSCVDIYSGLFSLVTNVHANSKFPSQPKLDCHLERRLCGQNTDPALKHAEELMFGINGQARNDEAAFKCLIKILESSLCPRALGLIGFCLEFGIGCKQDYEKCMEVYKKAVLYEDALAMSRICDLSGMFYVEESNKILMKLKRVVERTMQDKTKCLLKDEEALSNESNNSQQERDFSQGPLKWLWWAANDCSNAYAQYALGSCFEYGAGTSENLELAVKWYWRSTRQGCVRGKLALGQCYRLGNGVQKNEKAAHFLFTQAAVGGESFAMWELGFSYQVGSTVPKDSDQAHKLYAQAIRRGYRSAATKVGNVYLYGVEMVHDDPLAMQWFHVAAELGCAYSKLLLGTLYKIWLNDPIGIQIAFKWNQRAAIQGNAEAKCEIGKAYLYGCGVQKNETKGVAWLRRAVEQKCSSACGCLARYLESGLDIPFDPEGALKMVELAIEFEGEHSETSSLLEWATSLGKQVSIRQISEAVRRKVANGIHLLASSA